MKATRRIGRVLGAGAALGWGALASTAAEAHSLPGPAAGLVHGFLHPIGGVDHVLAMVAVGLLAARLGGRALLLVPAAFLAFMAAGGVLGALGVGLPGAEIAIASSVLVLGSAVAGPFALPATLAAALAGGFALFHGHAHGAEMGNASGLSYGAGFLLATALLHGAGAGIGLALGRHVGAGAPALRGAGALTAAAGLVLLLGTA